MRSVISESGVNSLAGRRKLRLAGGQGVHREVGSEGHEEKYRAVIDGGHPEDEPVGQRWDQVEPALRRRRRSHSPTAPRCLRTARYGRTTRDLRRTDTVCGWHRDKWTNKPQRNGKRCRGSSRTAWVVPEARRKPCDRAIGDRSGSGKAGGRGQLVRDGKQVS